jgi:predicted nucleotidyltransferase
MEKKIQILQHLKKHLRKHFGDDIKDVILFGSQITNKSNEYSDYDILIIVRKKPDWKLKKIFSDLCYDIDLKFGIITQTHILADTDLMSLRGKQPIFQKALTEGIHI